MKRLNDRSKFLDQKEIEEFISDHIPYRLRILHNLISYPNPVNKDTYWPSIYESAQIVCRMFIEFFGFGVNGKDDPVLVENRRYFSKDGINSYEVKIKDLGFDFINLQELSLDEQSVLAHAYEAGNRATAHLTYKSPFITDHKKVIQAASIIIRIFKERIKNYS